MADIVMVYPKAGTYETIFKDLPLSLICSANITYHEGYDIKLIDQRIDKNWKNTLKKELDKQPLFFATSVMTGKPINYALEISRFDFAVTDGFRTLEQQLEKTRDLKQGMMQELLTGRIRLV